MIDTRPIGNCRLLGTALLIIPLSLMVMTSAAFIIGSTLAPWMFPAAIMAAGTYLFVQAHVVRAWRLSVIMILIIGVSLLLTGLVYDYAYDSLAYHQQTALVLARGWAPLYFPEIEGLHVWTINYPKFIEVCQGCIFSTTGLLETGRAINFIFIAAFALMGWDLLSRFVPNQSQRTGVLIVALANPVIIVQCFTSYIDFYLYIFLGLSLIFMTRIYTSRCPQPALWGWLLAITLFCAGTKLNIIFYQGLALMVFCVLLMVRHRRRQAMACAATGVVALALTVLMFYHPYVTNVLWNGHPFYPLLGEVTVDIMTDNTPEIYLSLDNRFANFVVNLFGSYLSPRNLLLTYDHRVGGFGPFLVVMLIIVAWRAVANRKTWNPLSLFTMIALLLACFCFKQSWWARYIAFLWFVPVVGLICMQPAAERPYRRIIVVCASLTACLALCQPANCLGYTYYFHYMADALRGHTVGISRSQSYVTRTKLNDLGIDYAFTDSVTIDNSINLGAGIFLVKPRRETLDSLHSEIRAMPPLSRALILRFKPFPDN